MVGDHAQRRRQQAGQNAVLYLINDSYDGLREGQLRLAVNKDEKLIEQFSQFLGQPIAEIPDPYDCHASFAEHYLQALLKRLRRLDIFPVVMDAYCAYRYGDYAPYIDIVFARYNEIQQAISARFPQFGMRNLFRVQCPQCRRIDQTEVLTCKDNLVHVACKACSHRTHLSRQEWRGKLSWKLDCAARWNLYGIDAEAFSKSHTSELGSYVVSCFLSKEYFGGQIPKALRYGEVKLDRDLSYRLLEILPPTMLKQLMLEHPLRDLDLNKASIEHFARRVEVATGLSYVDFVKRELPALAISKGGGVESAFLSNSHYDLNELLDYGNRFSGYYFHQEYDISLAGADAITSVDKQVAFAAQTILEHALEIRMRADLSVDQQQSKLMDYLQMRHSVPGVYPYLRRIFSQQQGPGIATLLATLPTDYLNVIRMAIGFYVSHDASACVPGGKHSSTFTDHKKDQNRSKA